MTAPDVNQTGAAAVTPFLLKILTKRQLADLMFNGMTVEQVLQKVSPLLLIDTPYREYSRWSRLDSTQWANLLINRPEFAEHARWSKLDQWAWARLLSHRPEFAEHCNWSKIVRQHLWDSLIAKQPQFAVHRK